MKLFYDGGLSKNVDHQGWPTTKSALKLSPKNADLDQNINDSKISYLEFFFWKYYFGHTKFLYLSRRSSGYHQIFFNFIFSSRKSQMHSLLSMSLFVAFLIYSLPLPKWRTCWMISTKTHNIAMCGILCNEIRSEW